MSDACMIRAERLSKKFGTTSRGILGLLLGSRRAQLQGGEFWALSDVDFELTRGRCLGVMGHNGSGKTTLLRLLQGIYPPDRGQVLLRGQVGSLLAAGAGFAPVLTGRENIEIQGRLLGLSRRDIVNRFDAIVAFADIGPFLDAPVKSYSSGMQVRLGFAIAAHARPDILLIDEVLAVGDMSFQKRCYEHMHRLKREGTTIVLVSHAVGAVWALADCGLFLERGRSRFCSDVHDLLRAYKDQCADNESRDYGGEIGGTGDVVVNWTRVVTEAGGPARSQLAFREPFLIESEIKVRQPITRPVFRYTLDATHYKYIACLDSIEQHLHVARLEPGTYVVRTVVPEQNLMPGRYAINSNVCQEGLGIHLYFRNGATSFMIRQPPATLLYGDDNAIVYLESRFDIATSDKAPSRQSEESACGS